MYRASTHTHTHTHTHTKSQTLNSSVCVYIYIINCAHTHTHTQFCILHKCVPHCVLYLERNASKTLPRKLTPDGKYIFFKYKLSSNAFVAHCWFSQKIDFDLKNNNNYKRQSKNHAYSNTFTMAVNGMVFGWFKSKNVKSYYYKSTSIIFSVKNCKDI